MRTLREDLLSAPRLSLIGKYRQKEGATLPEDMPFAFSVDCIVHNGFSGCVLDCQTYDREFQEITAGIREFFIGSAQQGSYVRLSKEEERRVLANYFEQIRKIGEQASRYLDNCHRALRAMQNR